MSQRPIDPLAVRFGADHLTREPLDYLADIGFEVETVERWKWGVVQRVRATNPPAGNASGRRHDPRHFPTRRRMRAPRSRHATPVPSRSPTAELELAAKAEDDAQARRVLHEAVDDGRAFARDQLEKAAIADDPEALQRWVDGLTRERR